jgi:hypothetical protein
MAANKTTPKKQDVAAFVASVEDKRQRADVEQLSQIMAEVSGQPAVMWGDAIVGFGSHHYRYESGREGDTVNIGFSPRKGKIAVYGAGGFDDYEALLERLGPHSRGAGCLYLKKLDGVDVSVLREVLRRSYAAKVTG